MDPLFASSAPIKSALFVDFDNIYIGLSKTDADAAERFASDPARWLAWLEKGLPNRNGSKISGARERSILIRRCYPNPDAGFRRFRSFFTSAAFSVIDCPSLTRTGKNSSDIYMVMDILDTLNHKTHFDEFIIFSGDSDFMPVLLRLRAHDRRTTTMGIDFMPPAFKAACDLVISEEEFIEEALAISHDGNCAPGSNGRSSVPVQVLKEMAISVYKAVCEDGEVPGAALPEILKDFREFRDSNNWLGFGTSQRLAEALACSEPRLNLVRLSPMTYKIILKPQVIQPAAVVRAITPPEKKEQLPSRSITPPADRSNGSVERSGANGESRPGKTDLPRMRSQIVEMVREMVSTSPSALLLARVSQYIVSRLGPQVLETQWAGAGSFKRLLQGTSELGLEITTQPEPGYIFDPRRHVPPTVMRARNQVAGNGNAEGEEPEIEAAGAEAAGAEAAGAEAAGRDAKVVEAANVGTASSPIMDMQETGPQEGTDGGKISQGGIGIAEQRAYHSSDDYQPLETNSFRMDPTVDFEERDEEELRYDESLPSPEEFALRVSRVTGAPDLSSSQYALVFRGIVQELQAIAQGEKIYNTYQSSKAVSDWCVEQGEQVSRGDVVLILKGIIYQDGVRFGRRPDSYTEQELASVVRDNIKALCRRSRLELSEYENHLLDEWILGGLAEDLDTAQGVK